MTYKIEDRFLTFGGQAWNNPTKEIFYLDATTKKFVLEGELDDFTF